MIAKKVRYGKTSPLPEKMHFLQLSNSQTIRLFYELKEWKDFESNLHLLSIRVNPDKVLEFHKKGFLLGIKVSLNKKKFFLTKSLEYFQSIHKDKIGCLNEKQVWVDNAVYTKTVYSIGKFRYYFKQNTLENHKILKVSIHSSK